MTSRRVASSAVVVVGAAGGGAERRAPVAELPAARDEVEPALRRAVVEAAGDGRAELAGGAREQVGERGQRVGGHGDGADGGARGVLAVEPPQLGDGEAAVAAARAHDAMRPVSAQRRTVLAETPQRHRGLAEGDGGAAGGGRGRGQAARLGGRGVGHALDRLEREREVLERQPVAQQRLDRVGGRRAPERIALHELDAEVAQPARLLARLDALGDDRDVHRAGHRDDRPQDVAVALVLGHAGDELAVDLDRLDREALDVVQGGVAGAEVVEHQAHAEALEVLEHRGRRGALLHQHALGQLEPEALGRHAGLAQDGAELVGQRGLGELAAGEVDGQAGEVDARGRRSSARAGGRPRAAPSARAGRSARSPRRR